MTLPPGIQAIRERTERATAGPWKLWAGEVRAPMPDTPKGHESDMAWSQPIALVEDDYRRTPSGALPLTINATFIAAARTDVPAILDLIEELAGALERLRLEIEATRCDCGEEWESSDAHDIVSAALDKYREFGT